MPINNPANLASLGALHDPVIGAEGGTGIDNTGKTITLGASLATTGASAATLAFPSSGTPTYTFPAASQTLAAVADNVTKFQATAQTISNTTTWTDSNTCTIALEPGA